MAADTDVADTDAADDADADDDLQIMMVQQLVPHKQCRAGG